jgi:hypothetical protein
MGELDWLEAVMAETILSAGTLRFGKPRFTFVCAGADLFKTRLIERYPEIEAEADLGFVEARGSRPWELVGFDMAHMPDTPATGVYSLFPDGANALTAAVTFLPHARAVAGFNAPLFVLAAGDGFARPRPGQALEAFAIVPFGGVKEIAEACGLAAIEADVAEREYHEAYRRFGPTSGDANKPWADLKEEYRISNRRAVMHIYAKLFEAGFDLRTWMGGHDVWRELPTMAPDERLYRNDQERDRLAELEHRRWISDRRLSGWRYGPERDNARKLHPDIKPFDELTPEVQGYDRQFIEVLDKLLKRKKDGLRRA